MSLALGKDNIDRGLRALEARMAGVTGANSSLVKAVALELERSIKLMLSKPGTGKWYGNHQASAPGEPPAVDTGTLRASIGHETVGGVMRIGTGVRYADFLEYGHGRFGRSGSLAPRPFMRPALEACKDRLHGVAVTELRRNVVVK